jgi:hypothetical protein
MKWTARLFVAAIAVAAVMTVRAAAADQAQDTTWRGKISDAMCGASHGANGGDMKKDHDCALKCAPKGGFVFVTEKDKKPTIYKIANQDMKEVTAHAGHVIDLTGTLKGDTITISKVVMLPVK